MSPDDEDAAPEVSQPTMSGAVLRVIVALVVVGARRRGRAVGTWAHRVARSRAALPSAADESFQLASTTADGGLDLTGERTRARRSTASRCRTRAASCSRRSAPVPEPHLLLATPVVPGAASGDSVACRVLALRAANCRGVREAGRDAALGAAQAFGFRRAGAFGAFGGFLRLRRLRRLRFGGRLLRASGLRAFSAATGSVAVSIAGALAAAVSSSANFQPVACARELTVRPRAGLLERGLGAGARDEQAVERAPPDEARVPGTTRAAGFVRGRSASARRDRGATGRVPAARRVRVARARRARARVAPAVFLRPAEFAERERLRTRRGAGASRRTAAARRASVARARRRDRSRERRST